MADIDELFNLNDYDDPTTIKVDSIEKVLTKIEKAIDQTIKITNQPSSNTNENNIIIEKPKEEKIEFDSIIKLKLNTQKEINPNHIQQEKKNKA